MFPFGLIFGHLARIRDSLIVANKKSTLRN